MKKVLAVMTMNMDKIIFEKNKNGTITGFKSHTISNEVLDELMPWNEKVVFNDHEVVMEHLRKKC